MFRKVTVGLTLSTTIAMVFIVGMMFSCSIAESSGTTKKVSVTAAQSSSQTKAIGTTAKATTKALAASPKEERQLVVYYFMTTYRCPSCHFIEEFTRAAINENFAGQLKSGSVVFKMLNIEEPGNEHFATDYNLATKSVVLSDLLGGKQTRWANLEKVWQLIGNQQGFKEYIVKEVNAYLGA